MSTNKDVAIHNTLMYMGQFLGPSQLLRLQVREYLEVGRQIIGIARYRGDLIQY